MHRRSPPSTQLEQMSTGYLGRNEKSVLSTNLIAPILHVLNYISSATIVDLCPTEADARRVGESACQVLDDRWPSSFADNSEISGKTDEAEADTTSSQEEQAGDEAEGASLHEPQADD